MKALNTLQLIKTAQQKEQRLIQAKMFHAKRSACPVRA
jgi:hypothetical protein